MGIFDIFKKKKKPLGFYLHPDLSNFSSNLNDQQKAAMFYSMLLVLAADGPNGISNKMSMYIHDQADSLRFDLTNNQSMADYSTKNADYSYEVLKTYNKEQQLWFATSFYSMLSDLDDKASQNQISLYLRIGEQSHNPFIK